MWPHVRVDRKPRLWLVANGRWTELEQLLQHFWLYGSIPRTELRDGRLYAMAEQLPGAAGAPANCLELSENQTALSGCIERVAWHDDRLEVHGWAFIRGLDLASVVPQLTASLTEPATGFSYPCEVTQIHRVAANEWSMLRYQDVAPGGFVISIDTRGIDRCRRLAAPAHGSGARSGANGARTGRGTRWRWSPDEGRNLRELDDTIRVVPKLDPRLGFALHVRPELVQARQLTTDGAGKAAGTLRLVDSALGGLCRSQPSVGLVILPETSQKQAQTAHSASS